ncbi:MAG: hypothetical protein FWC41_03780 [Firmicutes bacterium]|nr:hypothetical protein [Bacillota bacterium]
MVKFIFLSVAILGLLIAYKFKGVFHKIISIGLFISALLLLAGGAYFTETICLLSIATFIYGLILKELDTLEKVYILVMSGLLAVRLIVKLMSLPFPVLTGIIKLSLCVPVLFTLFVFIRNRKLTREMSFMIFWLLYASYEFYVVLDLWEVFFGS